MIYTFKIQETATYFQEGTVDVEADSLAEAYVKAWKGEYDHHGDNEVLLDTELDTEVVDVEFEKYNEDEN